MSKLTKKLKEILELEKNLNIHFDWRIFYEEEVTVIITNKENNFKKKFILTDSEHSKYLEFYPNYNL